MCIRKISLKQSVRLDANLFSRALCQFWDHWQICWRINSPWLRMGEVIWWGVWMGQLGSCMPLLLVLDHLIFLWRDLNCSMFLTRLTYIPYEVFILSAKSVQLFIRIKKNAKLLILMASRHAMVVYHFCNYWSMKAFYFQFHNIYLKIVLLVNETRNKWWTAKCSRFCIFLPIWEVLG